MPCATLARTLTFGGELCQLRLNGLRQQNLRLDLGHLDVAVGVAVQQELFFELSTRPKQSNEQTPLFSQTLPVLGK